VNANTLVQAQVLGKVQGDSDRGHVHYGHGMHHSQENGAGTEEPDDDLGDEEGLDEVMMHSDGGGQEEGPVQPLSVRSQGSTQLTLSYQGEVYVFDTVPPEKVRSCLLVMEAVCLCGGMYVLTQIGSVVEIKGVVSSRGSG
jgi:hypothetical protein